MNAGAARAFAVLLHAERPELTFKVYPGEVSDRGVLAPARAGQVRELEAGRDDLHALRDRKASTRPHPDHAKSAA